MSVFCLTVQPYRYPLLPHFRSTLPWQTAFACGIVIWQMILGGTTMSIIRPFKGIRPRADLASAIAALPYDVYNSEEAREIVAAEPKSFLQIDRAETLLPKGTNPYSEAVYKNSIWNTEPYDRWRFFSSGQKNLVTTYTRLQWTEEHRQDL